MSDEPAREEPPSDIDWQSPRWREADERQGDAERDHRLHDDGAPAERGAIDRGDSVGRAPKRRQPADGEPA